jgi:CubicO group peptidase (beta-lactamase class C family)
MATQKPERLEEQIGTTLEAWNIPGAALAIVQNGEVLLARGYGVRRAGDTAPVDADTLMGIGSNTKAFTAAALALLVDEGRIGWDDPVTRHLPEFALADPWVTGQVTIRDLLTHRLGLPGLTRLAYRGYPKPELVRRLRYAEPVAGFRERFIYDNPQYTAAGLIVEAASGMGWEHVVRKRIFTPLGMSRSVTSVADLTGLPNVATPHTVLESSLPPSARMREQVQPIPWHDIGVEPAGSIISTANDLARWLQLLLGGGRLDGQTVISPASFAALTAAQIAITNPLASDLAPLALLDPPTHFWAYGLGWFVMDYRGRKLVMHGGQVPGFNAVIAFCPTEGWGFAAMVNVNQTLAHAALLYQIADGLLGVAAPDWSGMLLGIADGIAQEAIAQLEGFRPTGAAELPQLNLERYIGTYASNLLGEMTVERTGAGLVLHYGAAFCGELEPLGEDRFLARWCNPIFDPTPIQFVREQETTIALTLVGESTLLRQTP